MATARDFRAEVRARLGPLELPGQRELEIVEELANHLAARHADLVAAGLSDDEAFARALEDVRPEILLPGLRASERRAPPGPPVLGAGRASLLGGLARDLRHGLRLLVRQPGFTAVTVLTLGLGIGAVTAVFSAIDAVMLRQLPFPGADRLVRIDERNLSRGWTNFGVSYPNFLDWRQQSRSFAAMAGELGTGLTLTSLGDAEVVSASRVSRDFFAVAGARPALGRGFSEAEDRPGGPPVAIVGHAFWRQRLGGDAAALGRTLVLDGIPHTIVGVAPDWLDWDQAQLFVPLQPDPTRRRNDHRLHVIGRLADGVSAAAAGIEMDGIAARLAAAYPESNAGWTIGIVSFRDWLVPAAVRRSLLLLAAAAGFVLLITCANVANLFLARAAARRREMAIRAALGASRGRIAAQLVTEAALAALAGGAVGLALAFAASDLLRSASGLPRAAEIGVDLRVVGFALAASTLTALLFGLAPAIQASRPEIAGGRTVSPRHRLRHALVVAQVALSVTLLAGAGLLGRSFARVATETPGFQPDGLLALRVDLPRTRYPDATGCLELYQRVLREAGGLPGIDAIAIASLIPLGGGNTAGAVILDGRPTAPGAPAPSADWRVVSPGYFRVMGIPVRGREFAERDGLESVIVSEELARRFWPGEEALGKRLIADSFGQEVSTVIGVAGDVKSFALDGEIRPMVYGPLAPLAVWRPMFLVARSTADPALAAASLRAVVRAIDATVPLHGLTTFSSLLERSLGARRFNLFLLGAFAGVALALACVGLFGVMTQLVIQRRHEVGIRLALGARPRDIFRQVIGRGLRLAGAGAAVGLAGALWLSSALRPMLYGVEPNDPVALGAATLLLLAVAALAAFLPARRAMRVEPIEALRAE
jgi:putative ABC transport system permease protein